MTFTADFEKFKFETDTFVGKRVLITGSGKDGGIGQALALAAAANGARAVGIHFHSSYRDGFDMVSAMQKKGLNVFAMQADVTNTRDLWASRSFVKEQLEGQGPDILICNSGLTEGATGLAKLYP